MILYIDWLLPIRTVSEANLSDHWVIRQKRKKLQKKIIDAKFKAEKPDITFPCTICLTRIGLREIDADDNLRMALKHVKDAIADNLIPGLAPGQADGDKRLQWQYKQEPGHVRRVRIEIYSKDST